jgi:hypothetical protein
MGKSLKDAKSDLEIFCSGLDENNGIICIKRCSEGITIITNFAQEIKVLSFLKHPMERLHGKNE